ncbi:hypothetical protein FQN55_004690 [Onygenales sp. PD_40]|nr:hypothetical protein FQN55_004690 [Onygenales sp. PD_40]
MEALGAAASVITIVEVSAKAATSCLEYINRVKASKVERKLLQDGVKSLLDTLNDVARLLDGPNSSKLSTSQKLRQAVHDCLPELQELEKRLRPKKPRKIIFLARFRDLKWPFEGNEAERRLARIKECREILSLALHVDHMTATLNVEHSTALAAILSQLPSADGATFDSHANEHDPRCHPETRTALLQQILAWARDPQSEAIFWLNGMAGTGKSTVSRTVARTLSQDSTLGASFFFKRGEGDRGHAARFFSTIATQLVAKLPPLLESIKKVVDTDPGVSKKTLTEQFEKLILEPLINLEGDSAKATPLVIVIDALDECERKADVKTILYHLARTKEIKSVNLRIFATSRPELPIQLGFKNMPGDAHRDLLLHELPVPIIEHDISVYLKHELSKIKDEHNTSADSPDLFLPVDWPGQPNLDILVKMAVPLFIFAATVCRFIGEPRFNPQKRLEDVLKYHSVGEASKFDITYLPVLDQLIFELDKLDRDAILAEFEEVVGTIIVLNESLSVRSLANILRLSDAEVVRRLKLLHSVLSVPRDPESPIRLLHLSFRDYLLDPKKSEKRFFLDETKQHRRIALKCLEMLSKSGVLKTDICGVKEPGTLRTEIPSQKIQACLPPEVRYACYHWVHHFQKSGIRIRDGDEIDTFLRKYLLHWFEALSLCGKISQSIAMITTLQGLVIDSAGNGVAGFLYDTKRFVIRNRWIIDTYPLQIYLSALAFSPTNSILKKQFQSFVAPWIRHLSGVDDDWGPALQNLDHKSGYPGKITFSNTGNLLAISTFVDVAIWDCNTGELRQKLRNPSKKEYWCDVTFAHRSNHFAVTRHHSVQVIDPATGVTLQELLGDGKEVFQGVTFSPNDKLLAAQSCRRVRVWDSATWELLLTVEGSSDKADFSPDSNYLAFSVGNAINVWNLCENRLLRSFRTDEVKSFITPRFTGNGTLASTSLGKISIWDVATGKELHAFKSYNYNADTVISGDGKLMAYIHESNKSVLLICEPSSGRLLHTLRSKDYFELFLFSADSNKLIMSTWSTMGLWDIYKGQIMHTIKVDAMRGFALSRDSKLLASTSSTRNITLWDLNRVFENQHIKSYGAGGQIMYTIKADGMSPFTLSRDSEPPPFAPSPGLMGMPYIEYEHHTIPRVWPCLALSPDANFFASSHFRKVSVYDRSHTLIIQLDRAVHHLEFSENSQSLIMWSAADDVILSFNLVTNDEEVLCDLNLLRMPFLSLPLAFTDNFESLAIGDLGKVYVFNLQTREAPLLEMSIPYEPWGRNKLKSLKFVPDGKLIAVCEDWPSKATWIHVWRNSVDFGAKGLVTFNAGIYAVGVSPDSKLLVGYNQFGVGLFDLTTGKEVRVIEKGATVWEAGTSNDDYSFIETKHGILRCPSKPVSEVKHPAAEPQSPFKLFYRHDWILRDGKRLLWIPPDYRPDGEDYLHFQKNTFLIQSISRVIIIEIACD